MAKKPSKKQFDWRTYSRPDRLLTPEQEDAFSPGGLLAPVLELALGDPRIHFQIRARSAALYYRGTALARIKGDFAPFAAEFEAPPGAPAPRTPLETAADVEALLATLAEKRAALDEAADSGSTSDADTTGAVAGGPVPRPERDYLLAIAGSNPPADADALYGGELVVIDLEYTYGKRRYDLIALRRVEGVSGLGGFAHPRLVFIDARVASQPLGGQMGLDAVAGDFADFAKALGGSHLARAKGELLDLTEQKVRLGLLPADLEVREIADGLPEFLVLFAGYPNVADRTSDAAIIGMHERLALRHFPTEQRLRFANLPSVPDVPDASLALGEDDIVSYRQFKEFRQHARG